jgi:hypothetical protein
MLLDRFGDCEARDEGELLGRRLGRRAEEHRDEERAAGDVLPPSPLASAAGGLVVCHGNGALGKIGAAEQVLGRAAGPAPEIRPAEAAAEERLDALRGEELVVIHHELIPSAAAPGRA